MTEKIIELALEPKTLRMEGIEAKKSIEWIRKTDYSLIWRKIFSDIEAGTYSKNENPVKNIMWDTLLHHYKVGAMSMRNRKVAGGNNCNYEDEECDRWKREYERVNNSYSYRLGLACTYIPRRVIKTLRKIKRKLVLFIRG